VNGILNSSVTLTGNKAADLANIYNPANWTYASTAFPITSVTLTPSATLPTVTTTAASSIASTSSILGGNVTADGGATVDERGVVYSTTDNTPTIAEGATKDANGSGTGVFSETVGSLNPGTTYYYNAYAHNSAGYAYGTATSFTTLSANNAPTNISLSATSINENVAGNSTVGTLSSTDPDAGNTFTYTLVSGTGDTDNASFNISGNSLRITSSPDYEKKSSYSVRVRTTDQGGLTYEKAFTITINDLAEGVLLSTSPTLTFTSNSSDITGDDIATDGEGGSQAISDIDIQIYNISNTGGTLLNALSWKNNTWLASNDGSYSGLTNEDNAG
jgi:hypothetical protein